MRIDNNELIGIRISKFRKLKNFTQAYLAEQIGLSTTELSNLERGKNNLSYPTLIALCRELDVCPCQLLAGAIKDSLNENIIDLIRELTSEEQRKLYVVLTAYIDDKNLK